MMNPQREPAPPASGPSAKQWILFFAISTLTCIGIGLKYLDYQRLLTEQQKVEQRVALLKTIAAGKERKLQRMSQDKGREIEVRKRGWLKAKERPLPPIESTEEEQSRPPRP